MYTRDKRAKTHLTNSGKYAKILSNRKIEKAILDKTAVIMSPDMVLTDETVYEVVEIWRANSKLWSMAEKHYGEGRYYWLIGLHNDKPTDAHWKPGDKVYIPQPLEYVMSLYEY